MILGIHLKIVHLGGLSDLHNQACEGGLTCTSSHGDQLSTYILSILIE